VETQEFSIPNMGVGHLHTSNGKEVAVTIPSGSAATNTEGITSFLYDAGLGKPEDFTDEAKGKIALISRGEITFRAKVDCTK